MSNQEIKVSTFCPAIQKQASLTLRVVAVKRSYGLVTGEPVDCLFRDCVARGKIKCMLRALRITTHQK